MPYEAKPGTFSLFKNDKKEKETQPDYRGNGKDLDGNMITVAAWIKEGQKGKFMSCRFELAKAESERPAKKDSPKGAFDDIKDDLPFRDFLGEVYWRVV